MKKKTLLVLLAAALGWAACSDGAKQRSEAPQTDPLAAANGQTETHGAELKSVELTHPLDQNMVKQGVGIYDVKCASCHKLTAERLVGPGWAGVTKRREPVWIMNMITNVDMMLEKDPEAQKLLEQCLVRMPNQNLSQQEARSVLEFMRKNDGEK